MPRSLSKRKVIKLSHVLGLKIMILISSCGRVKRFCSEHCTSSNAVDSCRSRVSMQRSGPRLREATASPYAGNLRKDKPAKPNDLFSQMRRAPIVKCRNLKTQAVLQQDRRRQDSSSQADAASRTDARHQATATSASADSYISLNEAQSLLNEVVDAGSATPPVLLRFCESGQQVRNL